jgi:hypothetical protein
MKAKLISALLLLVSHFSLLTAQVPQGFNYQAIARDVSGNPIINTTLQVKLALTSDSLGTNIFWEELFNPVPANAYGLFTVVLGRGIRQTTSTVPAFTSINWNLTPIWVRTKVFYQSNWKDMGSTRLWSVPYALLAERVATLPYVNVTGETTTMDSALFVVRNNTGQIIFAVYNEGVRIYVDDGLAKGATKGGFAIGSFDRSKGTSQPLFVVDPDSIRAYIDNNPVKAVKGGFAIGGFDRSKLIGNQKLLTVSDDSVRIYINDDLLSKAVKGGFAIGSFDKSKGGNINYFNVSPDSTGRIYPSQNRILWYPLKNAFLTGKVIAENKDSIGENSFASGYESRSKGKYSQALGYKAIARGDYSTAIGKEALASGQYSFAFGYNAVAQGNGNYAFGSMELDTLTGNTIPGTSTVSNGKNSIAFGMGAKTLNGSGNIAIGIGSEASGTKFSLAIGESAKATNTRTISLGHWGSFESPPYLILMQKPNLASGYGSVAIGYGNTSTGSGSLTMGTGNTAVENYSFAVGRINRTMGQYSMAIGYDLDVTSYLATAIGRWNYDFGTSTSWISTDPIFTIGIGYQSPYNSSIIRKNAMTVLKNGNIGLGTDSPTQMLEIKGTNFGSSIFLNNTTSNAILFNTYGIGAPTFTSRSAGSKIVLYPEISSTSGDYAIGISNSTLWYSVPRSNSNTFHKFYAGTSELMCIRGNGTVGIGTSDPTAALHLKANAGIINIEGTDHCYINWYPLSVANGRKAYMGFPSSGTVNFWIANENTGNIVLWPTYNVGIKKELANYTLEVNGTAGKPGGGSWSNSSDLRLKNIHGPYSRGLNEIVQLQPVLFNYLKNNPRQLPDSIEYIGFIAQEVQKVFPESVSAGDDGYLDFNMHAVNVALVNAIKEQQKQIESQQKEIDDLKALVSTLVANQTRQENK